MKWKKPIESTASDLLESNLDYHFPHRVTQGEVERVADYKAIHALPHATIVHGKLSYFNVYRDPPDSRRNS